MACCPICGRYAPPDPETGFDADTLCPTCQADGSTEDTDGTFWHTSRQVIVPVASADEDEDYPL